MTSFFSGIPMGAPIEVYQMNDLYNQSKNENKVNLTVGAYRTEEGKPWVLPVVKEAEKSLVADESLNHEYLPVLGLEAFSKVATKLALSEENAAIKEGRVIGVQCLSGTGSLRMGAEFLARILKLKTAYYSDPTWGNHDMVFTNAGFTSCHSYRFWDPVNKRVDIEGFLEDLESAPSKSVIILHGCAHNPTGMDPTKEQWKQICEVVKRKNLFTFFDMAYQGFASGDPLADGWAPRYFIEQGLEMFIAQSFAKNFGLYNERVGHLTVVLNDPSAIPSFKSQMQLIIRANWSNPPAHGARIVAKVLGDRGLYQQWLEAIQTMSSRIREMRAALKENLEKLGTPGTWDHITQQIGMFSYTGLTRDQVLYLVDKYHIFMLTDGRANICGLNTKNVEYVAKAIDDAIRNVKS